MRRACRDPGFTLLELLVALAIFALVSVMAYTGLVQTLQARERLAVEQQFWRGLFLTFRRLEDDLGQTRPRSVRGEDGNPLPALRGQPVDPRALGAPSLEFTRGGVLRAPVDAGRAGAVQDTSDFQRVGYRLAEGVLYRLTWTQLDRPPQSEPVTSPLMPHVEEFSLRFFDANGQWLDEWPPRQAAGLFSNAAMSMLPRGVEVKMKLAGYGEFIRTFLVAP